MGITNIKAQENLTYQLPPESILQLRRLSAGSGGKYRLAQKIYVA